MKLQAEKQAQPTGCVSECLSFGSACQPHCRRARGRPGADPDFVDRLIGFQRFVEAQRHVLVDRPFGLEDALAARRPNVNFIRG